MFSSIVYTAKEVAELLDTKIVAKANFSKMENDIVFKPGYDGNLFFSVDESTSSEERITEILNEIKETVSEKTFSLLLFSILKEFENFSFSDVFFLKNIEYLDTSEYKSLATLLKKSYSDDFLISLNLMYHLRRGE